LDALAVGFGVEESVVESAGVTAAATAVTRGVASAEGVEVSLVVSMCLGVVGPLGVRVPVAANSAASDAAARWLTTARGCPPPRGKIRAQPAATDASDAATTAIVRESGTGAFAGRARRGTARRPLGSAGRACRADTRVTP